MPESKEIKQNALAKVSAAMTALDMYPDVSLTNTNISNNISLNPLDLLVDLFKQIKGYDWIIDVVSKFIAIETPILEYSVKSILISNIQTMLTCSIKPIISEEMIKKGVVFDITKIDLLNMFNFSPLAHDLDNPGRYYYFGCNKEDGIEIIDDLVNAKDFNAFLWYLKNTPGTRIRWRREKDKTTPISVVGENGKQPKSNAVATIEFNGRSSGLTDAEGNGIYLQEPVSNCVHVFIGNTAPINNREYIQTLVSDCTKKLAYLDELLTTIEKYRLEIIKNTNEQIEEITSSSSSDIVNETNNVFSTKEEDLAKLNNLKYGISNTDNVTIRNAINGNSIILYMLGDGDSVLEIESDVLDTNAEQLKSNKINYMWQLDNEDMGTYLPATSNYYYKKTLMEWNTDFVWSMKLFDPKVLAAQVIEALTNCLKYGANAKVFGNVNVSLEQQYIEGELRKLVTKVIESDDAVVNDCFFSFDNDTYNSMLQETEMNRVGIQTNDGINANSIPNVADVMKNINELSPNATEEELITAIKGSIFTACSSTKPRDVGEYAFDANLEGAFGLDLANQNIIEQLLDKLVYSIVMIVMSPKVYILLMTNLKIMGEDPQFDPQKFLQQFKSLIVELIRGIRDQVLEWLRTKLLELIQNIAKKLAIKLSLEQYKYYIQLLTSCIDCIHINSAKYDWGMDAVEYADIYESKESSPTEEC